MLAEPPPLASPIAMIGATPAKVTPCSRGSRTPTFQNPTAWMIEAIPQVNRSAVMSLTSSSSVSPTAPAMMMGTRTAPA